MMKAFLMIALIGMGVGLAVAAKSGNANPITDGDPLKEAKPKRMLEHQSNPWANDIYPGFSGVYHRGYGGYHQAYLHNPYYNNALGYGYGRYPSYGYGAGGYPGLGYGGYFR